MLTSAPSTLVLFCPTIPLKDPATSKPNFWSNKPTAAAATLCPAVPPTPKSSSPMSDVHVCPYPRRGLLNSCPLLSSTANNNKSSGVGNMDIYSLDYERIASTVTKLEESGWYYGQLSWQQATDMLKGKQVGTFLIRDSSDSMYLFALSVQTERGPTSIRIHYCNGQFKLDAEDLLVGNMPLFDCVVKLVDYYVKLSQTDKAKAHVWLDVSGRRDRPIQICRPLYHRVPQLQHLCRLVLNGQVPIQRINQLNLPKSLETFLRNYPYER